MPKYFPDERKLPFQQVRCVGKIVSVKQLEAGFAEGKGSISLCAVPEGFPAGCLGYVFNIKCQDKRFVLYDIVGLEVVSASNLNQLAEIINHVSGAEYNPRWQVVFQKRRNEIGIEVKSGAEES